MSVPIYDFLLDTRDLRVVSPDTVLHEATKNTYTIFSRTVQDAENMFRGGERLVDIVQGEDPGTADFYNPTQRFNPSTRDTAQQISVPWAFMVGSYVVIHEAKELNRGDPSALAYYVDQREADCVVSKVNRAEKSVWDDPNVDLMESENISDTKARLPYSIKALVTRDGLAPSSTNGGVASGTSDWTTVMQINPSNNEWWQNQHNTYTAASATDPDAGIIPAFDDMQQRVHFDMPGPLAEYANDPRSQKRIICTSREGVNLYKRALRAVNDEMANLNDPAIKGPNFAGIPMLYVSDLDDDFTSGQPDYFWLNLDYLFPFWHSDNFFRDQVEPGGPNDPNKTVVYKWSWMNWFMRSRRRQGRISASGD